MWQTAPPAAMKLQHFVAHGHGADHSSDTAVGDGTFTLRLVAIFVILVAGLLGVIPPLIGSWLTGAPNGVTARLIRACSGGIILALALVSRLP